MSWDRIVKAGTHCGMRSEYIPGSRDCHGKIEGSCDLPYRTSAFKHRECCVPFVQVTDSGVRPKARNKRHPPMRDDLLLQTHLGVSAIKLTGDSAVCAVLAKLVSRRYNLLPTDTSNSEARSLSGKFDLQA